MPLSDKNILITPNRGAAADPTIVFSGANVAVGPQNITATALPLSNGTVSFSGSAGQLFSITNSLTGSIFSVNDVSGIPSIEVNSSGVVTLAQFSGNVGIGTASPTQKLDVVGIVRASDQFIANGGGRDLRMNDNFGGTIAAVGVVTANPLMLFTSNTERIRIDAAGNVGIGTTGPGTRLDVNGVINVRGDNTEGGEIRLANVNNSSVALLLDIDGSNNTRIFNNLATNTIFFTNASERMRIDSSGNVGIGTTGPGVRLDVSGSIRGSQSVTIGSGGNYEAGSLYSDGNWGMIFRARQASPAQAQFRWASSVDGELMRISSGGNLGIGTTNPVALLHVGSGVNSGSMSLASAASGGGGASNIIMGNNDSGGVAGPSVISASNRTMSFGVGNSFSSNVGGTITTYLFINANGLVGIGNTSPAVTLDMNTRTDAIALPRGTTAQRPGSAVDGWLRLNTDLDTMEFFDSGAWKQVTTAYSVEYLVVAGGGGGGTRHAGGGGGGGMLTGTTTVSSSVGYNVVVGGGGAAGVANSTFAGNGLPSSVFGVSTVGGGGGGQYSENGGASRANGDSGGSGGGGANNVGVAGSGGAGTAGQGNNGGSVVGGAGAPWAGAGGGGRGAAGGNAPNTSTAGAGGAGASWLNGSFYAGGGGGGGNDTNGTGGAGGVGGGGAGGGGASPGLTGTPGTANTGGGGGGGRNNSGASGGSGVVIIRYPGTPRGSGGSITQVGGFTYHQFNTSGTFTA